MINQTVGPGNTGDILYFMRVLLFIAFLSMGYALSRPKSGGNKDPAIPVLGSLPRCCQEVAWPGLLPWQRKASEKAVTMYALSQGKKWQRWNEAMFERPT